MAGPSGLNNQRHPIANLSGRAGEMLHLPLSPPPPKLLQDGPVAILWDIENCPVPSDVNAEDVAGNIRMALKVHSAVRGAVMMFSAYGDFNHFPRRLREGCQRTGVNLIDVPNGKKDAADKAILVDMFLFALDNRPPCTILLISGDVDFAPALHKLGQRGYNMVLAVPAGAGVSSVLCSAGRYVWDWLSIARGAGLVPAKPFLNQSGEDKGTEDSRMGSKWLSGDDSDCLAEDEHVVTMGLTHGGHLTLQKQEGVYLNVESESPEPWVQPGDLQGLQGQLLWLVKLNGGKLPLLRLPAEYCKLFGRPLYLAEYGSPKLVHLIERMPDAFIVKGQGKKRILHLNESVASKHWRPRVNAIAEGPSDISQAGKCGDLFLEDGEDYVEDIVLLQPERSSDDDDADNDDDDDKSSEVLDEEICAKEEGKAVEDGEEYMAEVRLEVFKQEVQELLVSCACQIPLSRFQALYQQRYAHELDLAAFGVAELEMLFEKVADVATLKVDQVTNRKFLVANLGK